jgi:hypothetical protein
MYLVLLITHFIGLALAVGTGFASLALGMASKDMAAPERGQFMMRAGGGIAKNGSIGLALLLLSGLGMWFMRGISDVLAWGGPAFHAKLTLVVLAIIVFGLLQVTAKKVRQAGGGPLMARLPKLSGLMLLLGVSIIVSAVIAFK